VTILNADAQNMPLADNTFDYVLSNLCLHNISAPERACKSLQGNSAGIKAGGIALIADFKHTGNMQAEFEKTRAGNKPQLFFSYSTPAAAYSLRR